MLTHCFYRKVVTTTVVAACQLAHAQSPVTELTWESRSGTRDGIKSELSVLYATLDNLVVEGTAIKTRSAVLISEDGRDVRKLALDQGLFAGSPEDFPGSLEQLLCRLNADICVVLSPRVNAKSKSKKVADWKTVTRRSITVPNFKLQRLDSNVVYFKHKGDTLKKIVTLDRGSCTNYDLSCRTMLKTLNSDPQGKKLLDSYDGPILVPSPAFNARLPLSSATASKIADGKISSDLHVDEKLAKQFVPNVVIAPQFAKSFSVSSASPNQLTRAELSKLISYSVQDPLPGHALSFGMIDTALDLKHCDFELANAKANNRFFYTEVQLPIAKPAKSERAGCGKLSRNEISDFEHGTHLLGIVAGRKGAKSGEGLLPTNSMSISYSAISMQSLKDSLYYSVVGGEISKLQQKANVVNISWGLYRAPSVSSGMRPSMDSVEAAIRRSEVGKGGTLFVVAVGNDNSEMSDRDARNACAVVPACPSRRSNVLTVTGLTDDSRDPDLAPSANWGDAIDIAAPAVNVLSASPNDNMATGSGSSQAAAIVSSVVAMLLNSRALTPAKARKRLIFTSDLTPTLQNNGGKIFGGRVNFEHAYELKNPWLQLKKDGKLVQFDRVDMPRLATLTIAMINQPASVPPSTIDVADVRRLHRNSTGRAGYTIFYVGKKDELLRIDGNLLPESNRIQVQIMPLDSKSPPRNINLSEIYDYIAPSPEN